MNIFICQLIQYEYNLLPKRSRMKWVPLKLRLNLFREFIYSMSDKHSMQSSCPAVFILIGKADFFVVLVLLFIFPIFVSRILVIK